ncbi:MAG: hypothetical protein ACI4F4_09610 [Lachnospiraceae bacterium]
MAISKSDFGFNEKKQYVIEEILIKPECYNREVLCYQLEHPEEIVVNDKGEMAWITDGEFNKGWFVQHKYENEQITEENFIVILAPPVLMAICMGRYDLVNSLIESGYATTKQYPGLHIDEISGLCINMGRTVPLRFLLGQFVMGDPHMPNALRLDLWHQLAQEKRKFSKENKVRRQQAVNFSHIRFEGDICMDMFGSASVYRKTFLKTLTLIGKKRPRYLKNIVNNNLDNFFSGNGLGVCCQVMQILLKLVPLSDCNKIKLLRMMEFKDGFIVENMDSLSFLYERIGQYYKKNEALRNAFFEFVLENYMSYYSHYDNRFGKRQDESLEKKLLALLRKYLPKDFYFHQLLIQVVKWCSFNREQYRIVLDGNELCFAFRIYKILTNKKIVLDNTIVFRDSSIDLPQDLQKQPDVSNENMVFENIVYLKEINHNEWIQLVEQFSYDDSLPLNWLQIHVLKSCGEDMLIFTMKRGLFRGKHIDAALEYCMSHKELYHMIPCITAFRKLR